MIPQSVLIGCPLITDKHQISGGRCWQWAFKKCNVMLTEASYYILYIKATWCLSVRLSVATKTRRGLETSEVLPARIFFFFSTSSLPQNFSPSYLPPPSPLLPPPSYLPSTSPLLPTTYLPPHSIARAPKTLSKSELGAWSQLGAGASLELGASLERERAWSLEPAWSGSELGAWSGWSRTHAGPR